MSKKLYVGNLPYTMTENDLRSHFEQFGAVESVNIIKDRESGRPKGFGFVTMVNDADADASIEKQNGKELNGRSVTVSEARPPQQGGGGGGGHGGPRRGGHGGGGYGRGHQG
jgi:RNA recognition motif-containing protein